MKKTINLKEMVIKQRRMWSRNPSTKIEENKKIYDRSAVKNSIFKEIREELNDSEDLIKDKS